jgi:hypothetical protein
MELLFVVLIAFGIGLAAVYLLPGRENYGSMLVPSIAASVSAIAWAALTWSGWKFDGGWIWVASFVAGGVVALVLSLTIPRARRRGDEELMQKLSRA